MYLIRVEFNAENRHHSYAKCDFFANRINGVVSFSVFEPQYFFSKTEAMAVAKWAGLNKFGKVTYLAV
jgi:hypothetical protein